MGQSRDWPDRKVEKRRSATWHHLVRRLLAITSRQQQTQRTLLDWLRVEYGIEKPSNKRSEKLKPETLKPETGGRKAETKAEIGKAES
jgi:hypothetical protein